MEAQIEMMKIKDTDVYLKNYINRIGPDYLFGRQMRDYVTNSIYDDWCRWYFPNNLKDKIEDNQLYVVWYESHDASDPMDSSETNNVLYIERAPKEIQATFEGITFAKNKLQDYKKERQQKLSV